MKISQLRVVTVKNSQLLVNTSQFSSIAVPSTIAVTDQLHQLFERDNIRKGFSLSIFLLRITKVFKVQKIEKLEK